MKKRYYIGVEGGGTQTRALLADQSGRVWGCGHAGSANRNHYSRDQVRGTLQRVLREALCVAEPDASLSTVFLALGGVSPDEDRQDIATILHEIPETERAERVVVENDTVVGLTGGLSTQPDGFANNINDCQTPHDNRHLIGPKRASDEINRGQMAFRTGRVEEAAGTVPASVVSSRPKAGPDIAALGRT
jgi:hypothetical protein